MKTIKLGNREITIVGSPLTPYFYKKAFNQSFSGDLLAMQSISTDQSKLDDINMLQMVWAMEYTYKMGKNIKDFEGWLAEFEYLDISVIIDDVIEEAMNATFRGEETQNTEE